MTTQGPRPEQRRPPSAADTSVLIPYFRSGAYASDLERAIADGRLYLPSLVALELYAGTRDREEKRYLDAFVGSFERRGLLLTPTHEDHVLAGTLMSRHRRLAGDFMARDHLVDALIVLSAAQIDATVLTNNVRHLDVWAKLARRAGRRVWARLPRA